jgi:hypothetical protein
MLPQHPDFELAGGARNDQPREAAWLIFPSCMACMCLPF